MKNLKEILNSYIIFFHFFSKRLRLSNPWKYKIPFLISILYFIFLMSCLVEANPIPTFLASLSVIIGVAGIGYLTNDLGDRKKDAVISKENATSNLSTSNSVTLFILFSVFTFLPWFYLYFDVISAALLGLQILLFIAYAFPPFRFKEKGMLGIITDSLYAHAIPAILATFTFYKMNQVCNSDIIYFTSTLVAWQFILGLRNIVFHQLKDFENDSHSNTKTFVILYGFKKSETLCKAILIPIEAVCFFIFIFYVSSGSPALALLILLFWIITFYKTHKNIHQINYRNFAYTFLDDLYIKWVPVFVLCILCFSNVHFCYLLVLHFLFFRNEIKTYLISKF